MESSLEEAYIKLQEQIEIDARRQDKRFLPLIRSRSRGLRHEARAK